MLVLVAVSSKKRDTRPKLASFIYASSRTPVSSSWKFRWFFLNILCVWHTHTHTHAHTHKQKVEKRATSMVWSKTTAADCCYPNTKYITMVTIIHLHNCVRIMWSINDGHPWSSYSITLTKTSVEPFSRIFSPRGGSGRVWGLEQKTWKTMTPFRRASMCELRVSLPHDPKYNFKAHRDNSLQTRSSDSSGTTHIRLFAPGRDLYITYT